MSMGNDSLGSSFAGDGGTPVPISSSSSLDSFAVELPMPGATEGIGHEQIAMPMLNQVSPLNSRNAPEQAAVNKSQPDTNSTSLPISGHSSYTTQIRQNHQQMQDQLSNASMPLGSNSLSMGASSTGRVPGASSGGTVLMVPPHGGGPSNTTIPEFLYQLTKMLTDDNREIIEWSNGEIKVHHPYKLESQVLHKYFRHSKFASFQRQLNYFGFRKLAGKGKMAPCSYINDSASGDISSLLLIKRKTTTTPSRDKSRKKEKSKAAAAIATSKQTSQQRVNPVLAGILHRTVLDPKAPKTPVVRNPTRNAGSARAPIPSAQGSHQALAQAAVGRGVRHTVSIDHTTYASSPQAKSSEPAPSAASSATRISSSGTNTQNDLSELALNYKNSLNDFLQDVEPNPIGNTGFLSRNSSLIDLAMIPSVEEEEQLSVNEPSSQDIDPYSLGLNFVDFPNSDFHQSGDNDS